MNTIMNNSDNMEKNKSIKAFYDVDIQTNEMRDWLRKQNNKKVFKNSRKNKKDPILDFYQYY